MNVDVKTIVSKIQPLIGFLKRYITFMFFISMLLVAVFLVYRINQLSTMDPTEDAVAEKLQTVQRPRLDQDTLQKILELEDQNVEVQSLFDQARNNPFSE